MGGRGGSQGGRDLMDNSVKDSNELGQRDPQPTEEGGKQSFAAAWKHRK